MARPIKENLSYFSFDVDFFSDKKIKRLKAKFGADGIVVYQYILCEIYHNGYYIECDEDFILDISDYFNFSENKTMQILNYLFNRSLLVSILVESVKVITATSVQRRYQTAKKEVGKTRDIFVDERIWLLKEDETKTFIKVRPIKNNPEKTYNNSEKIHDNSEKNSIKESKGKESKEKESRVEEKLRLPARDGWYILTQEFYSKLESAYPETDIDECLRNMSIWLEANRNKLKPINEMDARVNAWIAGDTEQGKCRKNKNFNSSYDLESIAAYDLEAYEKSSIFD